MADSPTVSERVIKAVLREAVKRFARAKLIDIELIEENFPQSLNDLVYLAGQEPFRRVPVTRIPKNSKLKLHLKVVEPRSGRRIDAVASTRSQGGTLRHTVKIESPQIETLRGEIKKKKLTANTLEKVLNYILRILQVIISYINLLINSGYIKSK